MECGGVASLCFLEYSNSVFSQMTLSVSSSLSLAASSATTTSSSEPPLKNKLSLRRTWHRLTLRRSSVETDKDDDRTSPTRSQLRAFLGPLSTALSVSAAELRTPTATRLDRATLVAGALVYSPLDLMRVSVRWTEPPRLHGRPPLTIVFDLDNTIAHTMLTCYHPEAPEGTATVFFRPFLLQTLHSLRSLGCRLFLYTSSVSRYADAVLSLIDPAQTLFSGRFHRKHVTSCRSSTDMSSGWKSLSFASHDLERCLLIDDLADSFGLAVYNGWRIRPYQQSLTVTELSGKHLRRMSSRLFAKLRKLSPPVVLNGEPTGHGTPPRVAVAATTLDFSLLNLYTIIRLLLKSDLSVPSFTRKYHVSIGLCCLTNLDLVLLNRMIFRKRCTATQRLYMFLLIDAIPLSGCVDGEDHGELIFPKFDMTAINAALLILKGAVVSTLNKAHARAVQRIKVSVSSSAQMLPKPVNLEKLQGFAGFW